MANWESGHASGRIVPRIVDASVQAHDAQRVAPAARAIRTTLRNDSELGHADFSRHRIGDEALALRLVMQPVEISLPRLPGAAVYDLRRQFHTGVGNLPFALSSARPIPELSRRSMTNPLFRAIARNVSRWQLDSAATNAASGFTGCGLPKFAG